MGENGAHHDRVLSPTIPAPIIILTAKGKRDEQTKASLGRFFFVMMIDE
jgi:hypothetical protein